MLRPVKCHTFGITVTHFFRTFFQAPKINFQNLVKVDLKRILKFMGRGGDVMHFNFATLTGLYAVSIISLVDFIAFPVFIVIV